MGVADMTINTASIEAALFRSTGVKLDGMQYGPAISPTKRSYSAKGKGVGHVYLHGNDKDTISNVSGPAKKSRYENHTTMVAVIVEILKSVAGQASLKWLDDNPNASEGLWLHGKKALPVSGNWYGYEQNVTDAKKKIVTASINMRSHGDALFITSSYPDAFQAPVVNPVAAVLAAPKGLNANAPAFVPKGLL